MEEELRELKFKCRECSNELTVQIPLPINMLEVCHAVKAISLDMVRACLEQHNITDPEKISNIISGCFVEWLESGMDIDKFLWVHSYEETE